MKIAFFGDSLTAGYPGVSYVELLREKFPRHQLFNFGKGGDTVISLLRRLEKASVPAPLDTAFLWVGVNDVFVKVSWTYPIIKSLRRQPWAKDRETFKNYYRRLLDFLVKKTAVLFAVPPLLIGEDLNNPWNRELGELARIISELSAEHASCRYLDLHEFFLSGIDPGTGHPFVPNRFFRIVRDALALKTPEAVAKEAARRGLRLTLDGVHLNGAGAERVAEAFARAIEGIPGERSPD